MNTPMYRTDRSRARVRSRAGRGAFGESGAKRKWMFFFAVLSADEDFISAFASVEDSCVFANATSGPRDGDMLLYTFCQRSNLLRDCFTQLLETASLSLASST